MWRGAAGTAQKSRSCSTEFRGCKLEQAAVIAADDERRRFTVPQAADAALPGVRDTAPKSLAYKFRSAALIRLSRARTGFAECVAFEQGRGTPFLFAPVFLGLGAIAYFTAANEPPLSLLAASAILMAAIWRWRWVGGHRGWLSAALCLAAAGAVCAKIETMSATSTMLGGEISTVAELRIRKLEISGKSVRVVADVLATEKPQLKYAPARVRVTLRGAADGLSAGSVVKTRVGLQPPSGPVRPGGYDFAFHAWFAGIGASGYSMGKIERLPVLPSGLWDSAAFALENARLGIADRVRAVIPGTDGAMAAALIAGVSGGIDEATNEAMRVSGLAHIISISGLHMALVAGVFMASIRFAFALFPAAASRLPVKKYGAAAALAASFIYLLLSGAGVATVRSFIMLAVMLIAMLFDRQALTLRNLAISAIVILIVTPHEIMGPSFQMSFAATAALISTYSWLSERRQARATRGMESGFTRARLVVLAAILTPVVAGFATALFSAWHFHRISPMGLPANLAAMPVVSLIVMPAAVASVLAMPLHLEHWPLTIMGEGVKLMLGIARWFAEASPLGLTGAISLAAFLASTAALVIICLLQSRLRLAPLALAPVLLLMVARQDRPELLVAEDAKLAALAGPSDVLAVNRQKPNGFTLQTWQRAAARPGLAKPSAAPQGSSINTLIELAGAKPGGFVCRSGACAALTLGHARLIWLEQQEGPGSEAAAASVTPPTEKSVTPAPPVDAKTTDPPGVKFEAAGEDNPALQTKRGKRPASRPYAPAFLDDLAAACESADLVIAASPTPSRLCPKGRATLLRASGLARKGAAEITFTGKQPTTQDAGQADPNIMIPMSPPDIRFAVGKPVRPWNRERVYSRAARNMPEFKPTPRNRGPTSNAAPPAGSSGKQPQTINSAE